MLRALDEFNISEDNTSVHTQRNLITNLHKDPRSLGRLLLRWFGRYARLFFGNSCVAAAIVWVRFVKAQTFGYMADQSGISNRWEAMEVRLHRIEKLVVGGPASSGTDGKFEYWILNLFGHERRAKELENFLWDVKTYFQAARVTDAGKVSTKSMYLTGYAKLWWCSHLLDDANANREPIETWKVKPWAQIQLRRQGVKDLPSAIAAADRLDDFKVANDPEQRNDDSGEDNAKFSKKFKKKEKAKKVVIETFEPRAVERPRADCFICGNLEHRARECPECGKLNAIVAE
ncbi:hypothetical protein Sango_0513700 [Sesamum angolense]|uniref:CCHC-type domain-containing protein n=1 Tax=Sesamum angolense TaxID=2727404 RepID=A0AAE1X585_9LAMI|nr:hypothetical protein Sango_0513700 [Sesamum angolense]